MVNVFQPTAQDGISLTELALYHQMMDYRASRGLDAIPLSAGLSATAGRHVLDTRVNLMEAGVPIPEGNLHSWSFAPYPSDHSRAEVMWTMPQRLGTSYQDYGYEISATGAADVTGALRLWQDSPGHNAMILNSGSWAVLDWNAIGIGVIDAADFSLPYQGQVYHVWFGAEPDPGGAPRISGTAGNDTARGTDFADWIFAAAGADTLAGGGGADTLLGGGGFDTLRGGLGNDAINGGSNADNLFGEAGADRIWGDAGLDRAFGGTGADAIWGGSGNDGLFGQEGNDTLDGGTGTDRVFGGSGNDVLRGGGGADTLYADAGNDTLDGGTGDDVLWGKFNWDIFRFADGHGRDVIRDFDAINPFEKIDLRAVGAITGLSDLRANHASQIGSSVVIDTGGGSQIVLEGVSLADLDARDFIF